MGARLILCQRLCANGDSAAASGPAAVARLPVTPAFGTAGRVALGRREPAGGGRLAAGRRSGGGGAGKRAARGAGRSVAGGGARGRGKRWRPTRCVPGVAAAPPRPAPVPSGPIPQRPAASRPPAARTLPAAEALASASSAAMAQHFSLAACDVVGFDLDHTLCRYNLPESALVSGAGCAGRTACTSIVAGDWTFLRGWAASAAGGLQPPRLCAELGLPPRGRAEVCVPRALPVRSAPAQCTPLLANLESAVEK